MDEGTGNPGIAVGEAYISGALTALDDAPRTKLFYEVLAEIAEAAGLRAYLRDKRQEDYVDNLCRKLFAYALNRSLQPTDQKALDDMRTKLTADGYAFDSLVEAIATTPQFLNKRGRDDPR